MGILCVICIYDTIGNGCKHRFQKYSINFINLSRVMRIFPKMESHIEYSADQMVAQFVSSEQL